MTLKKKMEEQQRLQYELEQQEKDELGKQKRIEEQIKQSMLLKDIQGGFNIDFNEGKVQRNPYFGKNKKKKPKILIIDSAYDWFLNPNKKAIKKKGDKVFSQKQDYSHVKAKVKTFRTKTPVAQENVLP